MLPRGAHSQAEDDDDDDDTMEDDDIDSDDLGLWKIYRYFNFDIQTNHEPTWEHSTLYKVELCGVNHVLAKFTIVDCARV